MINNRLNESANFNVNRERRHENLLQHLVADSTTSIFRFNKDLMVFAAMIGYCYDHKVPLKCPDPIQIVLSTYASKEDDGFIYLLGLMESKDAKCLKTANLKNPIQVFEEYCNGGLDLLQDWFESDPTDIDKIETLEEKLLVQIQQNEELYKDIDNENLEVEF